MTVIPDRVFARQKRYPRYAQSESKWLLEYPEHWTLQKLKHVASVRFSNVDKHTKDGEQPVHLCNYVDVYYNQHISSDIEFMKASATVDEISRFSLRRGDVIVTKDSESWDDIAVPAYVSETLPGVLCGYHLALIRPNREMIDGKYLFQAFNADGIKQQFQVAATGITRYGLGKHWLENSVFPVPPMPEQRTITSFLDHKTAQIDALIAEKRKLIELLQEKRNALISHAVTKGLNPNVPMKDSGVEWIGEIPAHWEVLKTKYVFRLSTEQAPAEHDLELLSLYTDIGVRPRRELEPKGNKASSTDGYWLVYKGDIIVNKLLAWMGAIGYSEYSGVTSPAYDVLRQIRNVEPKYYHYLFRCGLYLPEFRRRSRGIMDMRLRLYFDELGQIPLSCPSYEEQKEIVAYIDGKIAEIEELESLVTSAIANLGEYRTALISAAVTGKIDVRGWNEREVVAIKEEIEVF